jgi:hypothetical protein
MISWATGWRKEQYETIAESITPGVILVTKDSWFWTAAWLALVICTLGVYAIKMNLHRFLHDYATTIGPIQGYPGEWETLGRRLLTHEARHTRQAQWFGYAVPVLGWIPGKTGAFIRALVGLPLFGFLYLIPIFPLGFAVLRWRFEIDAELTSYKWMLKNGYTIAQVRARAVSFGTKVCGGDYGWSWPKWLGGVRGFEHAADKAIQEVWK